MKTVLKDINTYTITVFIIDKNNIIFDLSNFDKDRSILLFTDNGKMYLKRLENGGWLKY
jgi:hypothetical protein